MRTRQLCSIHSGGNVVAMYPTLYCKRITGNSIPDPHVSAPGNLARCTMFTAASQTGATRGIASKVGEAVVVGLPTSHKLQGCLVCHCPTCLHRCGTHGVPLLPTTSPNPRGHAPGTTSSTCCTACKMGRYNILIPTIPVRLRCRSWLQVGCLCSSQVGKSHRPQ